MQNIASLNRIHLYRSKEVLIEKGKEPWQGDRKHTVGLTSQNMGYSFYHIFAHTFFCLPVLYSSDGICDNKKLSRECYHI
jgi:hypothetical protein